MRKQLLAVVAGAAYVATIVTMEARHPLRLRQREGKLRRNLRNLAIASLGGATIQLLEDPLVRPLAKCVEARRWGLLQLRPLPPAVELALGVALMDYTLYLWHVLTHKVPFLWRFHAAHHIDLDMDASTAIRFHFGELAFSAPYRALQVLVFGITPRTLTVWQTFTFASILFHHSNLRVPARAERLLQYIITTPRLHGIHHSNRPEEANSNWSSGLAAWDWMHGTLKRDVAQKAIIIGVGTLQQPAEVTLGRSLALPFHPPAAVAHFFDDAG